MKSKFNPSQQELFPNQTFDLPISYKDQFIQDWLSLHKNYKIEKIKSEENLIQLELELENGL